MNKSMTAKHIEIGAICVDGYIGAFHLAMEMRQFSVAKSALQAIDNMVPGPYFTEKYSIWFTKAKRLLGWFLKNKKRIKFPVYKSPRIFKRPMLRGGKQYLAWRMACLNRDSWTCQECGTKQRLRIHHIKSYKDHLDLRTDVNNGVVLCRLCHKNRHCPLS